MSDLVFDMGKFPAHIPGDRRYCKNHMWCMPMGDSVYRFGFTTYAVRLMQDVYFLEWKVNPGDRLQLKQEIGNIETSKAVSDLYAPLAGTLNGLNEAVLQDPSAINVDCHQAGWLFELSTQPTETPPQETLTPEEYMAHLTAGWENTQRILKGQMGD